MFTKRNKKSSVFKRLAISGAVSLLLLQNAWAAEFSASFKGTDIQEFINTVAKNLKKTVIIDPQVQGQQVNVRSYDLLNQDQYFIFFENVLSVYGYSVITEQNGVLKVVPTRRAKQGANRVADAKHPGVGDEMITRVVALKNVTARELSSIMRTMMDGTQTGYVASYDPSNVLIFTGPAAVINRMVDVVRKVDNAKDKNVDIIKMKFASASEVVRIVTSLNNAPGQSLSPTSLLLKPQLVADDRTNSVIISGDTEGRMAKLVRKLDREQAYEGNSRVFYLSYSKAEDLAKVLQGMTGTLVAEKQKVTGKARSGASGAASVSASKLVSIQPDKDTNALVVTAPTDIMKSLSEVIRRLDIRRAQVLVEAIIVERAIGNGADLGFQFGKVTDGLVGGLLNATGNTPSLAVLGAAAYKAKDTVTHERRVSHYDAQGNPIYENVDVVTKGDTSALEKVAGSLNGLSLGFFNGSWAGLLTAVTTNAKNNVLATPTLIAMDNTEASIDVGQDIPIKTSEQSSSAGSGNPFTTIKRQQVGIKLKITPQINEGDSVLLKVQQEASGVAPSIEGAADLIIDTRKITTSVLVKSDETVVLGGLIQSKIREQHQKVPILGDIPILGYLFRSSSSSVNKTNLMVFIHPVILKDPFIYNQISSKKYSWFRALQLKAAEEGVALLPKAVANVPVLKPYEANVAISPEMKKYLDQKQKEMEQKADKLSGKFKEEKEDLKQPKQGSKGQ